MNDSKSDTKRYRYTGGSIPVNVQVVGQELETIIDRNKGKLTPQIVLDEARDESHALHSCFEWNNEAAAEKHRELQARELIKHTAIVKDIGGTPTAVRAFVSIRVDEAGNLTDNYHAKGNSFYVRVETAMEDEYLKDYTLAMAQKELKNFRAKYSDLQELAKLFAAIEEVV